MKCFYHNSVDAVAICKNCNRGLCVECISEVENGVACKKRCEPAVEELNAMLNKNRAMMDKSNVMITSTRQSYIGLAAFLGCTGFLFLAVAPFLLKGAKVITLSTAGLFILFAIGIFFFARKIKS